MSLSEINQQDAIYERSTSHVRSCPCAQNSQGYSNTTRINHSHPPATTVVTHETWGTDEVIFGGFA